MNNNEGADYLLTEKDDQNGYPVNAERGRYDFPNTRSCVTNKYVQIIPSQWRIRPVMICMAWEKRTPLIAYHYFSLTIERNTHQENAKVEKKGDNLTEFEDSQHFGEVCRNNDYLHVQLNCTRSLLIYMAREVARHEPWSPERIAVPQYHAAHSPYLQTQLLYSTGWQTWCFWLYLPCSHPLKTEIWTLIPSVLPTPMPICIASTTWSSHLGSCHHPLSLR